MSLPLVRSGVTARAIVLFIIPWKECLFAPLLAGSDAQPLTVGITRFLGGAKAAAEYGIIAAHAMLVIAPVIVPALTANR